MVTPESNEIILFRQRGQNYWQQGNNAPATLTEADVQFMLREKYIYQCDHPHTINASTVWHPTVGNGEMVLAVCGVSIQHKK